MGIITIILMIASYIMLTDKDIEKNYKIYIKLHMISWVLILFPTIYCISLVTGGVK